MINHKLKMFPVWFALGLYAISMILPAFYTEFILIGELGHTVDEGYTWNGWKVLAFGWAAIFDWTIAWYANPLFAIATILLLQKKSCCFYYAWAALLVALTSFFYRNIWNDKDPPEHIASYGIGFYFWLLAFIVLIWATWSNQDACE